MLEKLPEEKKKKKRKAARCEIYTQKVIASSQSTNDS